MLRSCLFSEEALDLVILCKFLVRGSSKVTLGCYLGNWKLWHCWGIGCEPNREAEWKKFLPLSGQFHQKNLIWDANTFSSRWHSLANSANHYLAEWAFTFRMGKAWRVLRSQLNLNKPRTFGRPLRFPKKLVTCLNNYLNLEFIVILIKIYFYHGPPSKKQLLGACAWKPHSNLFYHQK